jgi:hypothetical protein
VADCLCVCLCNSARKESERQSSSPLRLTGAGVTGAGVSCFVFQNSFLAELHKQTQRQSATLLITKDHCMPVSHQRPRCVELCDLGLSYQLIQSSLVHGQNSNCLSFLGQRRWRPRCVRLQAPLFAQAGSGAPSVALPSAQGKVTDSLQGGGGSGGWGKAEARILCWPISLGWQTLQVLPPVS